MPQVTMPQLGEGVEQGTIGKWLKAVGDHVRIGDPHRRGRDRQGQR